MTLQYIDAGELVEVLDFSTDPEEDPIQTVQRCLNNRLHYGPDLNLEPIEERCRAWLTQYVKQTNHCAGGLTYRNIWKSILKIEDGYSFLKVFAANVHLMWD